MENWPEFICYNRSSTHCCCWQQLLKSSARGASIAFTRAVFSLKLQDAAPGVAQPCVQPPALLTGMAMLQVEAFSTSNSQMSSNRCKSPRISPYSCCFGWGCPLPFGLYYCSSIPGAAITVPLIRVGPRAARSAAVIPLVAEQAYVGFNTLPWALV